MIPKEFFTFFNHTPLYIYLMISFYTDENMNRSIISNFQRLLRLAVVVILAGFVYSGCAADPEKKAFSAEKILVASGFTYKVAGTPEKLAALKKLPQHKLIQHTHKGHPVYIYVDVNGCKCLFGGDEAAYQRMRDLLRSEKLTARETDGTWTERYDVIYSDDLTVDYSVEVKDGFLTDF